jgi:hypothetical protein
MVKCDCAKQPIRNQVKNGHFHSIQAKRNESILGNLEQFCQSFWHMRETPEAPIQTPSCLGSSKCSPKPVVCVAILLDSNGNQLSIHRYTSCADRMHAEEFLFDDFNLLDQLQVLNGGVLQVYLTLNPCHLSSNQSKKSCTQGFISLFDQVLKPNGTKLELYFGYPYRAHWDIEGMAEKERERYETPILNARTGISLLEQFRASCSDLVSIGPIQDWDRLILLCDSSVQQEWARSDSAIFTKEKRETRKGMDVFVADTLEKFK